MLFGKIDYLNLLPFHVFLKKSTLQTPFKKFIEYNKGVPSELCKKLYAKRVDAAIISSIESRRKKYKKLDLGIVAKKRVISVLVQKNSPKSLDPASMTSNMLSKILNMNGKVIIGDNALKAYLKYGREQFYDLGEIWNKKENLPFVFARFCYTKNGEIYKRIANKFLRQKIKIPRYILNQYAKTREISPNDIIKYLTFISYKIDLKEKKALKIFIAKAKKLNFNPN